ncbi:hypothetical protein Tco_0009887 [Tanacetum coccineum]
MAQQQRDVPQNQLCPPNKCFDLMDANKKFDLVTPPCPNENPETEILIAAEIDATNLAETIQISIATQRSIEDFKAQQNVEKVKEHMVDKEIENLVEGT